MRRPLSAVILGLWLSIGQPALLIEADHEEPARLPRYGEAVHLLETWVQSIVDYDRLPGLSLVVVHDQTIVYSNGFGFCDRDRTVKATASTVYSICSISKLLTAVAIMQLRDAGKLNLEDPVTDFLPWFTPAGHVQDLQKITLRELLRHTAGLPCAPDKTVWKNPADSFPSRAELLQRTLNLDLSYPPHTKFNYSNLGYSLLGQVVTEISGMEYTAYVREHILEPLGLNATTPYKPDGRSELEIAKGYGTHQRSGQRLEIVNYDAKALTPAMGFYSTVEDLAKFAMWQFRVLDGKDNSVLRQETLREMQSLQWSDPAWGLGFTIWEVGDKRFVGHQGGCPGFKSQLILCPEEKVAVVVMVNATDAPQFTLAFRTFEILAPLLGHPYSEETEQSDWEAYAGFYTSASTWSDAEVLSWENALALRWVPGSNPDPVGSLIKLTRIDGEVFRQVTADSELGKHYIFRRDAEGNVVSLKFNNNLLTKVTN